MKHILSSILLSLFLTACGGGSSVPTSVESNIPATLYDTSYKNFKLNGTDSLRYPNYQLRWKWGNPAVGFGDFLKAGELGVFVAYTNYEPSTPLSQIQADPSNYASEYIFYTVNQDKSLTKSISMKGCLNPRKAVVADFNKDGIADVFVACHGYDNFPAPGEKNQLNHGASAADINNDGYPDIVISNGSNIIFYINQQNGTFITDNSRTTNLNLPYTAYYNIELIDVDNDGKIDIVTGGHEHENAITKIIYANSDGTHGSRVLNIPSIQAKGVVNDFTLVGNILYVNRTSDSTDSLGWYRGLTIQSYNLTTGISSVVADVSGNSGTGPFDSTAFFQ